MGRGRQREEWKGREEKGVGGRRGGKERRKGYIFYFKEVHLKRSVI